MMISFAVPLRARRARLSARLLVVALAAATGLTCRDGALTGPGLPGGAVLAVSPQFATGAAGGPEIILTHVTGKLRAPGRADVVQAEATFEGDSAVLEFNLTVFGPSELFEITVEAADGTGDVVFATSDTLRLRAGDNPTIQSLPLDFVAPDTAAKLLSLSPDPLGIAEGESVTLTAYGVKADDSKIAVRAGWISRDPTVADVTPQGVLTGVTVGTTWIVATSFTGLKDSALVGVRLPAATKLWVGGEQSAPGDWQSGSNWAPAGVPTSDDVVQIRPGSPDRPVLTAPASIRGLILQASTGLDLGGATLTVSGDLSAIGPIVGSGTVVTQGTSVIKGMLPNLEVRGKTTLGGPVNVMGAVKVTGTTGDLRVASQSLVIGGDVMTESGGVLTMADPFGSVRVGGSASFLGGSTNGHLTAGELSVAGAFTVGGPDTTAFMATEQHRVVLDGIATQSVVMQNRGPVSHRFQNLEIRNSQGATLTGIGVADTMRVASTVAASLDLGSLAHVEGPLLVEAPVTVRASGQLTVAGDVRTMVGSSLAVGELVLGASSGTTGIDGDLSAASLRLVGSTQTIRSTLNYVNVDVGGSTRLDGPTTIAGNLRIGGGYASPGQFTAGGDLAPSGHALTVKGDLSTAGGTLTMTSDADSVHVYGNVTFDGAGDTNGRLTAGVLVVGGQFTVGAMGQSAFAASGRHRVVLDGTTTQTVSLALSGPSKQHIASLVVANPEGAVIDRLWTVGDLTIASEVTGRVFMQGDQNVIGGNFVIDAEVGAITGGKVRVIGDVSSVAGASLSLSELHIGGPAGTTLIAASAPIGTTQSETTLPTDSVPEPPPQIDTASVTYPGYHVYRTVLTGTAQPLAANLEYMDVEIRGTAYGMFGGEVGPSVGGTLRITGPAASYDVNGLYLPVGGNLKVEQGATIVMTKPGDGVSVAASAYFDSGDLTGKLTEGTLFVGRDFDVAARPGPTFVSTGNHTLVLNGNDGSVVQTIRMAAPGVNRLGRVHVSGTSEVLLQSVWIADSLSTDAFSGGRVTVQGTCTVAGGANFQGTYSIEGSGSLAVLGDLQSGTSTSIAPAVLELSAASGTGLVSGSFSPGRLVMAGTPNAMQTLATGPVFAYQSVDVRGDVRLSPQTTGTALQLAGDLTIAGDAARLEVNTASLDVRGNLTVAAHGKLVMRTIYDMVSVLGAATFDDAITDTLLTAGTLTLSSDLRVSGGPSSFAPSTGHTTQLAGQSAQSVTFTSGGPSGHRFGNLSLFNAGPLKLAGVFVAGFVSMSDAAGPLDFEGYNEIASAFSVINNQPLGGAGTLRVVGDLQTSGGVDVRLARLELGAPGGTLGVTGPFSPDTVVFLGEGAQIQLGLAYRTVIIKGRALFEAKGTRTDIAGDLVIADPESKVPGSAQLVVNGASDVTVRGDLVVGVNGRLVETNQTDHVIVDGTTRLDGDIPAGSLTTGVLELRGDLQVSAPSILVADAGHLLLLSGGVAQKLVFGNPGDPRDASAQALGSVRLSNRARPGAVFATGAYLQGDLTIDSDTYLALADEAAVYVSGVLNDNPGSTIEIPTTALADLSVRSIVLNLYTPVGKRVTDRQGQP